MGYKLTADQHREGLRLLGLIAQQLAQKEYPYDPERVLGILKDLSEGRVSFAAGKFPSEVNAAHLIPRGWKVVEDVEAHNPAEGRVSGYMCAVFSTDTSGHVSTKVLRGRCHAYHPFGLADAPMLIERHYQQDPMIPDIHLLPLSPTVALAGTVLEDETGRRYLPVLVWKGKVKLDFVSVNASWGKQTFIPTWSSTPKPE